MAVFLSEEGNLDTDREIHRDENHVKMAAEVGGNRVKAKDRQQLPAAGRGAWKRPFLGASGRSQVC